MLTWLAIKAFLSNMLSKLVSAVTFMIEHWKVFLPLLLCLFAIYLIERANNERDKAIADLSTYKTEQARLVVERKLDDAKRDAEAIKLSAKNLSEHLAEIQRLKLDRDTIKKDLNDEKYYIARILDANDRMQDANSSSAGLSEIPITASESSECGTDCNRTIANLTKAGQSCAVDYNSLYTEWMNNCKVYGCK